MGLLSLLKGAFDIQSVTGESTVINVRLPHPY